MNANASAFGLTTAGALYGWGANANGQLGVGDVTPRSSPVAVLGGLTFTDVFQDGDGLATSTFAITADGTLYAWGGNSNGQLGLGDVTPRSSPVAVLGGLKFSRVLNCLVQNSTGGGVFTLGMTTSNTLYAWGYNGDGQLGVGNVTPRSSPVAVLGGLTFATMGSPGGFVYGVTLDGLMYAWGSGLNGNGLSKGDLGLGSDTAAKSSPVAVLGGLAFDYAAEPIQETVIDVTSGTNYTVLLTDGMATFGNVPIGMNVDNITIEYDK